jgi:hypothetical protein
VAAPHPCFDTKLRWHVVGTYTHAQLSSSGLLAQPVQAPWSPEPRLWLQQLRLSHHNF